MPSPSKMMGVVGCALALSSVASPAAGCGMTLHIEVANRGVAYTNVEAAKHQSTCADAPVHTPVPSQAVREKARQLMAAHTGSWKTGAPFPDYLYSCGKNHSAGETAHWHEFHVAAADYIRERYPNWHNGSEAGGKLAAFMMGAVSHYSADQNWHGQRVQLQSRHRGFGLGFLEFSGEQDYGCQGHLCSVAHHAGDTGGEFVIHHQLESTWNTNALSWSLPASDLVEIFAKLQTKVSKTTLIACAVEFGAAVVGIAAAGELLFPKYASNGPFLQEDLLDSVVGGVDDMALWSQYAWLRFLEWLETGAPHPPPTFAAPKPTPKLVEQYPAFKEVLAQLPKAEVVEKDGEVTISWPADKVAALRASLESQHTAEKTLVEEPSEVDVDEELRVEEFSVKSTTAPSTPTVTGAGDTLDSFGFSEVTCKGLTATGSPNWSQKDQAMRGKVTVQLEGAAPLVLHGSQIGGRFGYALGCADADGDGKDDLFVSAPTEGGLQLYYDRQNYTGRVYTFSHKQLRQAALGKKVLSALDAVVAIHASGEADFLGIAGVKSLGDLDGDGKDEVAVLSPLFNRTDAQDTQPGVVHIFSSVVLASAMGGSQQTDLPVTSAALRLSPGLRGDRFGHSMCAASRSAAGKGTFVVGAPAYMSHGLTQPATGAVFVVDIKSTSGSLTAEVRGPLMGTIGQEQFGRSCALLHKDNLIAVSAPSSTQKANHWYKSTKTYAGRVYMVDVSKAQANTKANVTQSTANSFVAPTAQRFQRFGWDLLFQEEGQSGRLLVSAPFERHEAGAVYEMDMSSWPPTLLNKFTSPQKRARLGYVLSAASKGSFRASAPKWTSSSSALVPAGASWTLAFSTAELEVLYV